MQHRIAFVLASVFLTASAVTTKTSEQFQAYARAWLQQHQTGAPQTDELAELKAENPSAYAIVQALLTKRSLGLLDPRHPSASFAKTAPPQDVESGPEAFAKFASPAASPAEHDMSASQEASVVYPSKPAHRDWLNWRPASSAADDDAMVSNVLGAAAEVAPKKNAGLLAKRESADVSPLVAQAASLGMDSAQQQASQAAPVQAAPASQPVQSLSEVKHNTGSYLASFNWNDDAQDTSKQVQQPAAVSQPAPQIPGASNSLMAWLGETKKAPAPQEQGQPAASVAQKPATNSYLMDLQ